MAKKNPQPKNPIPVTSHRHADHRTNIPTEELRDFVSDDEREPRAILYPRDPSLDPQLVWKGKDEQDQYPLDVPSVPIYIQEKIQPQAIIENVRAQAKKEKPEAQMSLFSDFNGIEFEDLVDFYHHEQNWTNRMILGDSLLVMTSLSEKEGLKGKVQMIYVDPPYGIKFGSNWQVSTRKREVKDGKPEDATRQPEQIKAFRDTWQLGIHSYLTYLRDRLVVASELLAESGSIFVQIGDENVHLIRNMLDEVFGSENFCALIPFTKTTGLGTKLLASRCDFLLWYAKSFELVKYRQLYVEKIQGEEGATQYDWVYKSDGQILKIKDTEIREGDKIFHAGDASAMFTTPHLALPVKLKGKEVKAPKNRQWQTTQEGMKRLDVANRLMLIGNSLRYIRLLEDFPIFPFNTLWTDTGVSGFSEPKIYVVQTNTKVIERCILMSTDPGDLVLDPTCGSGTTAYVAELWGRRWITIDTSRVAIALARTRLMAGRFPYYMLADSPEGIRKEAEINGQAPPTPLAHTGNDVKKGFVFRRVPHITLKSIANNIDIDEINTKWQEQLVPLRDRINKAIGKDWQDWEIPRELPPSLSGNGTGAEDMLREWWRLSLERQKEIDVSIARHADTELLYDQPYEDSKRIRVTGPFTGESLSPHRVLSIDDERPVSEVKGQEHSGAGQFEAMIIDNLRVAGVQNTVKNERLKFTRLESFAGVWLHATGEYQEKDGAVRRAVVSIGPEHGTVGPDLIKDAAKEAVQGLGFDLLVVCGFAFDPHVSEETKRYGKLTILPTRINPDLQMGGTLLKNTGYGNLFMIFGEPDVDIKTQKDGKITVTIKGVDVYDPTTGEIRSSSTDDIACWFIDTNYDGESFFVRHAYFTGADEPYEKLRRALRVEIDEDAWSALYSTTSYPFDKPETGKIAVKVINHYGDEVLKVYPV